MRGDVVRSMGWGGLVFLVDSSKGQHSSIELSHISLGIFTYCWNYVVVLLGSHLDRAWVCPRGDVRNGDHSRDDAIKRDVFYSRQALFSLFRSLFFPPPFKI